MPTIRSTIRISTPACFGATLPWGGGNRQSPARRCHHIGVSALADGTNLLAGDEFARTQGGNNNGYCQDSEISWIDWAIDEEGQALLEFTRQLVALRREHIVF